MKLNELYIAPNSKLSHYQQVAILKIFMAQSISAEAAALTVKGDAKLMAAAESLVSMGLLVLNNGFQITPRGMNEMQNSGLIQGGKLTQAGTELVNANRPN